MKKLTAAIWLLACALAGSAQQFTMSEIPARLSIEQSPQKLAQTLDSASQHLYIPVHAKIYDAHLGPQDAVRRGEDYLWHLKANGLSIKAYLELQLPSGDTLFIYNKEGNLNEILHRGNHFQQIAITSFYEDEMLLRYASSSGEQPAITITEYSLQLKKPTAGITDFGDAAFCEINVNCSEGADFRDVAKSVVRIGTKMNGFEGWCTGTLVNNTAFSYRPYILTAEHCGLTANTFAAAGDLARWEFYFRYESKNCENPASEDEVDFIKLTGAELLARSADDGGDYGSDFILMELTDTVAFQLMSDVYFAGWNRADIAPHDGVTIHHPQGDIKKISTFDAAVSSAFGPSASNTHWEVFWVQTENGYAVTEFGSSGCPLFDSDGLLTGTLTGGAATCSTPEDPDYFGKFSYSWDQNGQNDNRRLEPWLDPVMAGVFTMPGGYRDSAQGPIISIDTTEFSVGPVPVIDGILEIDGLGTSNELSEFQIFSLNGSLLFSKPKETVPNTAEEIDVSELSSGVYILRVWFDDQLLRRKFIVIN